MSGRELWISDGTELGTHIVKDINSSSVAPSLLTDVNGTLYFRNGNDLWKSDGTESGTVPVTPTPPSIDTITNVNGTAFVIGHSAIWMVDPGTGTLALVKNLDNAGGFAPGQATAVGNTVYFTFVTADNGRELWKSDGTAGGTTMVKDIAAGTASSDPQNLTNIWGQLFFSADDGANGRELWKTDGSESGTVMVPSDGLYPGATGSSPVPYAGALVGLYYVAATTDTVGREVFYAWV